LVVNIYLSPRASRSFATASQAAAISSSDFLSFGLNSLAASAAFVGKLAILGDGFHSGSFWGTSNQTKRKSNVSFGAAKGKVDSSCSFP
jgi:hypothetical protein